MTGGKRLFDGQNVMLFNAFCKHCPAITHKPIVAMHSGKITTWVDHCPSQFVVGNIGCLKGELWKCVMELLEKGAGLDNVSDTKDKH